MTAEVVWYGEVGINIASQTSTKQYAAFACTVLRNAPLHLWAEVSHQTLDGPRSCVAQGADSTPFDLFAV
jgi:hypothetical protein